MRKDIVRSNRPVGSEWQKGELAAWSADDGSFPPILVRIASYEGPAYQDRSQIRYRVELLESDEDSPNGKGKIYSAVESELRDLTDEDRLEYRMSDALGFNPASSDHCGGFPSNFALWKWQDSRNTGDIVFVRETDWKHPDLDDVERPARLVRPVNNSRIGQITSWAVEFVDEVGGTGVALTRELFPIPKDDPEWRLSRELGFNPAWGSGRFSKGDLAFHRGLGKAKSAPVVIENVTVLYSDGQALYHVRLLAPMTDHSPAYRGSTWYDTGDHTTALSRDLRPMTKTEAREWRLGQSLGENPYILGPRDRKKKTEIGLSRVAAAFPSSSLRSAEIKRQHGRAEYIPTVTSTGMKLRQLFKKGHEIARVHVVKSREKNTLFKESPIFYIAIWLTNGTKMTFKHEGYQVDTAERAVDRLMIHLSVPRSSWAYGTLDAGKKSYDPRIEVHQFKRGTPGAFMQLLGENPRKEQLADVGHAERLAR